MADLEALDKDFHSAYRKLADVKATLMLQEAADVDSEEGKK